MLEDNNRKVTILLVEDEQESADMLAEFLDMKKFKVLKAYDGKQALRFINDQAEEIRLAILDIMVPEIDGLELCRRIRNHPVIADIPVIFLTAKDEEVDEIKGLNLGADDYITKPASLNLVHAHIQTLLRRRPVTDEEWLSYHGVSLNNTTKEVYAGKKQVDLTATEFQLLEMLLEQPKRVFSRQEILEKIAGEEKFVFDRTVDVHVKNIRIKLGKYGETIKTYRGLGYGMNKDLDN